MKHSTLGYLQVEKPAEPAPVVHTSGLVRTAYPVGPEPAHPLKKHRRECICWECVQERMLREW